MLLWMREKAECRRCLRRRCSKTTWSGQHPFVVRGRRTAKAECRRRTEKAEWPEEDGEGRVPEEDELMEDQYHFATANSGPPSSWVQIHVFDEENADRVDSQATTRRLGEHLNDDEGEDQPMPAIPEDAPPAKEVEDPVVNKVLQEMMTMGIERPAKAATVPVPEPREPFLQKEEDLGNGYRPRRQSAKRSKQNIPGRDCRGSYSQSVAGEDSNMHKDSDPVEGVWPLLSGTHAEAGARREGVRPKLQQAAVQQHDGHRSDAAADGSPRNHDPRGRPESVDGSGESKRLGKVSVEGFENCRCVGFPAGDGRGGG